MTLPYVTSALAGSGGAVKVSPEDFRVDELPAYAPVGVGPHLWLRVEKRGRTTRDVARALALALGVPERDVGWAGMKDRQAVTTQWLSFPSANDPDPASLAGDGFVVLEASRHGNKLRPGHARGNRFAIRVRGGDAGRARACAAALGAAGLPNFFGAQRFGAGGNNAAIGKALLVAPAGGLPPEARRAARDRFLRRLSLSAYQSLLFNRWLTARLADDLFSTALAGDVLKKLDSGGVFVCEDPAADGPRVARFEVSPAGPMFGHKLRPEPSGVPAEREARLLADEGMTLADFAKGGGEAEGTRRAARLPISVEIEDAVGEGGGYVARFDLPKGSYATVVLGELVKSEAPQALGDEE
ncbi:MAG: tRNA pseudouridine(13) synthase TruD [Anaeromyxobacteraceae bacterium]